MHSLVLASALHWDPQIRGFLIFLTAVIILPGSVFMILSTNVGAKIGFVLAATGIFGWICALAIIWAVYGSNPTTGMQGGAQGWVVKEIVTGDLVAHSSVPAVVTGFPNDAASTATLQNGGTVNGWRKISTGGPGLADAQAFADKYLTPAVTVGEVVPKPPRFAPPFKTTQDYVPIGGYAKQSTDYLLRIGSYKVRWTIGWPTWWGASKGHHELYIRHPTYYFVIRVQPALPTVNIRGAAPTLPAADVTKPVTSVVMVRDVGSRRLPALMVALGSGLIFAVCCSFLHRRDKEILRRKALAAVPA